MLKADGAEEHHFPCVVGIQWRWSCREQTRENCWDVNIYPNVEGLEQEIQVSCRHRIAPAVDTFSERQDISIREPSLLPLTDLGDEMEVAQKLIIHDGVAASIRPENI